MMRKIVLLFLAAQIRNSLTNLRTSLHLLQISFEVKLIYAFYAILKKSTNTTKTLDKRDKILHFSV